MSLRVGIQERPKSIGQWVVLSLQHVFAMFGATVLVPILTGLDTGVALVASGIGTLIYIAATKAKSPVYLGSSFAYIGAISTAAAATGFEAAYVGLMVVGLIYLAVALTIKFAGKAWIHKVLPPVVVGPMIIIIGLGLAPIAVEQSGLLATKAATLYYPHVTSGLDWKVPLVAITTFLGVVGVAIYSRGFLKIVPFLVAILFGYSVAAAVGLVDFAAFANYSFFQSPNFTFIGTYSLDFSAVLMFAPIAFVTMAEHIGDHSVLGEIVEQDLLEDPGLDNTLIGDGVATFVSAAIGGPANTTYGENTGVVAMTKVGSVYVTGLAAVFAILLGFFGWVQFFVNSIPWAVIGGMTIVLYGLIAGNGVKVLIKNKVNLADMRNLIIVSTMLVIGLGGAMLSITLADGVSISMTGMSLAAIVGILLNAFLHIWLPETE